MVGVGVRVRVISLNDFFSVLLRPQHLSMLKTAGRVHTSACRDVLDRQHHYRHSQYINPSITLRRIAEK